MNQAVGVGVREGRGDLARDRDRLIDRELPVAGQSLPQRVAPDVRHYIEQQSVGLA